MLPLELQDSVITYIKWCAQFLQQIGHSTSIMSRPNFIEIGENC